MYGFTKGERENLRIDEEKTFKVAAKHILALAETQFTELVRAGDIVEVKGR